MKKQLALIVCLTMLLSLAFGCAAPAAPEAAAPAPAAEEAAAPAAEEAAAPAAEEAPVELKPIKAAYAQTAIPCTLFYADTRGGFKALGLDYTGEVFSSAQAQQEGLAAGVVQYGCLGTMSGTRAGISSEVTILGFLVPDEETIQLYARNDSDIVKAGKGNIPEYPEIYGTPETWKGKTIIATIAGSTHYGTIAVLDTLGLTDSDISILDMEATQGAVAFEAGEGDVFCGWDPTFNNFKNDPDNYTCVGTVADTSAYLDCPVLATHEAITDYREETIRLLEAQIVAEDIFANDEALYEKIMYEWRSSVTTGETEASAAVSAQLRPTKTIDEYEAAFKEDADGNSPIKTEYRKVADFMVKTSNATQEEIDYVYGRPDFFVSDIVMEAISRLRAGDYEMLKETMLANG